MYSDEDKKRALAAAERQGSLSEVIKKYHPEYIFPDGTVKKFTLAKRLGWLQ